MDDSALVGWAPPPDKMETLSQMIVTVHGTRRTVSHSVEIHRTRFGAPHAPRERVEEIQKTP